MSVNKYDPSTGALTPVAGTNSEVMSGATDQSDGKAGLVPKPFIADKDKCLRGDGSWGNVSSSFTGTTAEWQALTAAQKAEYKEVVLTDDYYDESVFIGATASANGTSGLVPYPQAGDQDKFLGGDGNWKNVPNPQTMTGATASAAGTGGLTPTPGAGDEDKVLQGKGQWGKKLQVDIVIRNNQTGYINGDNQFVPFKSQADIDAAVAAARVGNATAADVLAGKTFTNASGSGLTGSFDPYSIFTDANKWTTVYFTADSGTDGSNYSIRNIVSGAKYVTFFIPYEVYDYHVTNRSGVISKIVIGNPNILRVVGKIYFNCIGIILFEGLGSGDTTVQLTSPVPAQAGLRCYANQTCKLNE